jgi:Tol biopolymer transport system component
MRRARVDNRVLQRSFARVTLRDRIQTTLGDAYLVESELRGGGMSHVFVATEQALGRRIVVKVLPPDTVAQVAIDRFKREIRVAASLQHPHIVPLLSAGDVDGLPYFTMPFVKGESLRERLMKSGELSVKETLHILRDVASALAYAHGEGIVHRDIKPDNILLSGGVAVVTDFGVAKAVDLAATEDGTRSSLTSLGVALGTPAYMAPEQASADPHVDHRADLYSFGCVGYEMLAGASPFAGRPLQQVLAAHVTEAPDPLLKRRPGAPPALAELIMRCLEKRPGDRPQSATEVLAALDAIVTPSGGSEPTGARLPAVAREARSKSILIGVVATLVVAAALGAATWALRGRTRVIVPGQSVAVATTSALEMSPAISPDGKFVAFMTGAPGTFRIMVRQISGERAALVSGELATGSHENPHWSPDGSQIAFLANDVVYVVPATGGAPKLLIQSATPPVVGVSFSPEGKQVAYADTRGVWVRSIAGGEARLVVVGGLFNTIAWSPNGRKLAFLEGNVASLANQSAAPVWVADVASGVHARVAPPEWINLSPAWLPDSRSLLYISNRDGVPDVYQQAITSDGKPDGAPRRITTGLGARSISLSADGGQMAYDVVRNRSNIWSVDLPLGNTSATTSSLRQITSQTQRIETMSVSHDGQWLAYDSNRNGNFDIYRVKIDGGEPVQVTSSPGNDFSPVWSPGDRQILFHSSRAGLRQIYAVGIDGTDERQLTHAPFGLLMQDQSPDGKQILVFVTDASKPSTARQYYNAAVTQDASGNWSSIRRVTPDSESATWARFSPDGRWIVYVRSLTAIAGTTKLISADGRVPARTLFDRMPTETVQHVVWGGDANTVYFDTHDAESRANFYAMSINGGKSRLIFRDDASHRIGREDFAVDARRLYVTIAADESDVFVMQLGR